jgi:hypothetical protein
LHLTKSKGGGLLRREIWVDGSGKVVRYNLAYINPLRYPHDSGRVLGFDNAHGTHHRHYMGDVTPVGMTSFAQIERRFQREWQTLVGEKKNAQD